MYFRVILSVVCLFISVNFAFAAPFAYIANSGDSTVSVIDTSSNDYIKKISLCDGSCPENGLMPYGVAVSKNGSRVYVSNQSGNSVSVIDALTDPLNPTVINTLSHASLSTPSGIAINPAGTRLYVANIGTGTVSVFDTTATPPVFVTSIGVGTAPEGVAVHPDGTYVYVANSGSNSVSVINTATNLVVATWPVGAYPMGLAVKIAGINVHLYVANMDAGTVTVMNAGNGGTYATVTVGSNPFGVVLSPDYSKAYVTNSGYASDSISVINTTTYAVTNIPLGTALAPMGIALTPNGAGLYAANNLGNSVSVLNTISSAVTPLENIPANPDYYNFFDSPLSLGNFIGPSLYTITSSAGSDGKITLDGTTPVTSTTVANGSSLTYQIVPDVNYSVNNVSVDGTGLGAITSYTFSNIAGPHDIQATFIKHFDFISVLKTGTGTGTVTSNTGGINCGAACYVSVTDGTQVTLTATPDAGMYFAGWVNSPANPYDDVCSGTGTCTFTMSAYVQPTASFNLAPPDDKVWKVSPSYYYSTLQSCFNALTAAATEVRTTTEAFTETLNLDTVGVVLTLRGGYTNRTFTTQGATPSKYTGSLTITNGTLIADNIAI
jgi:YVTN family beta-propeller protein